MECSEKIAKDLLPPDRTVNGFIYLKGKDDPNITLHIVA
jgi:hypothetical protein